MQRVNRIAKQLEADLAPAPCAYKADQSGMMASVRFMQATDEKAMLAQVDATMKKIKADGDVGSLPLLPFAAMAGARAHSLRDYIRAFP